jgi:hypothetical protein
MKASGITVVVRTLFSVSTLALLAVAYPLRAQATQGAPRVAQSLAAADRAELEGIRKAVWVDWFSGDTIALRRALGPELVAISSGGPHWQSLEQTLASSAKFKAGGGKLVSVTFDSTITHRFGDAVVMFSHYALVTESAEGRRSREGRATEVFVRAKTRWVHTSWHLDELPSP